MFHPAAQPLPAGLQQTLSLALHYRQGGQTAQAEAMLRQALALYPQHPLLLQHLGATLLQAGDAAAALPLLEQARAAQPADAAGVLLLAECLLALDRTKEAKKLLTEAIRQGLHHPRAEELLAQARAGRPQKAGQTGPTRSDLMALQQLLKTGRHAEAETRARALLQQHPQAAQVWRYQGMACLAQRRYEAAVEALERSLPLRAELAETQFNLGFALEQIGRLDEALAAYREAQAEPDGGAQQPGQSAPAPQAARGGAVGLSARPGLAAQQRGDLRKRRRCPARTGPPGGGGIGLSLGHPGQAGSRRGLQQPELRVGQPGAPRGGAGGLRGCTASPA